MAKMDDMTLRALLSASRANALAAMSAANLAQERAKASEYYLGEMPDMPVPDGRSKAVSSDVADTIEGLMPSLMDIFAGSDEVVRFEPVGAEDEQAAQQETDYVNHVFMQQNPGFMVLYSFIKDALLSKTGIVKVWWEEREQEERETYYDVADDQFAMLAQAVLEQDSGLEIIEHTEKEQDGTPDPVTGQPTIVRTHDVTILRTKKYAQAKVMGVPPEEFGIERNARSMADCNYAFHEIVTKTQAQLIAEGFDKTQVKSLSDYLGNTQPEEIARDSVGEHFNAGGNALNGAARAVRITEHYIRMDYEGTGQPQLYQVVTGGERGDILKRDGKPSIIPYDTMPFAVVTPVPVTHRFFGRSIADLVMDIQRIKTALVRGALDNLYLHNNPRVEVAESMAGANTLDDLLVSRPGGIVRTKQPGGLNWQVVPDITGSIYPALEYMDTTREMRTGVTRQGQGIDANALQNQTATAVNQVYTASMARMKLIARIIAETGIKDLFALLHATIRKHGQEAQTVRLRNQWVSVDPRNWKTRNDMTINVGLGSGGKAERVQHLMVLINMQKEALAGGKTNMVDDVKLFNSASELSKLLDYKNPDQFFNDPSAKNPDGSPKYPPAPPPPDPKVVAAQLKAQSAQQALQAKNQIEVTQAQADIATQNAKTQAEMIQTERDYHLKERMALLEAQLKERDDLRKHEMHLQDMAHKREMHQHTLQTAQLGMIATAQAADAKAKAAKKSKATKAKADA